MFTLLVVVLSCPIILLLLILTLLIHFFSITNYRTAFLITANDEINKQQEALLLPQLAGSASGAFNGVDGGGGGMADVTDGGGGEASGAFHGVGGAGGGPREAAGASGRAARATVCDVRQMEFGSAAANSGSTKRRSSDPSTSENSASSLQARADSMSDSVSDSV